MNTDKQLKKNEVVVNISGLFTLLVFLWLVIVPLDAIFIMFLTNTYSSEAASTIFNYGYINARNWKSLLNLIPFAVFYLVFRTWFRTLWLFLKTKDPALKPKARERIANIHKWILWLYLGLFAIKLPVHLIVNSDNIIWPTFFKVVLPDITLVYLILCIYTILFFDTVLFDKAAKLLPELYDSEELYRLRQGYSIPLTNKIIMIVFATLFLPMLLLYLFIDGAVAANALTNRNVLSVLAFIATNSFLPMTLFLVFLVRNIQKPINSLITKMGRLANGDYNVKTRVFFSDEIARLKASFNIMVDQLKERELLKETFGKYVSIEVARKLIETGKVNLGGEEVSATILFSDMRDFTQISEKMTATEVVDMLNTYFSSITGPIMENHGIINKFIGDAVLAIYTPALGSDDHMEDALKSALSMRKALAGLNAERKGLVPIRFGIGIHSGVAVSGNIGTLNRLEYTFIGDSVNVSSRVEGKTKDHDTDILITKPVYDAVKDLFPEVVFESLGPIALKGKKTQVELYKVT